MNEVKNIQLKIPRLLIIHGIIHGEYSVRQHAPWVYRKDHCQGPLLFMASAHYCTEVLKSVDADQRLFRIPFYAQAVC